MLSELDKLERAYDKASYKLRQKRDELYPVGTKGECKLNGWSCTIIEGSLYPYQIRTTNGHMSWRYFEPLKESAVVADNNQTIKGSPDA